MNSALFLSILLGSNAITTTVFAGQAPGYSSAPDVPISHTDRVYAAEQFSNTVSVTDPVDNKLLGVIRLGDTQPGNSRPFTRVRYSSTAWDSRQTTKHLRSCQSVRTL